MAPCSYVNDATTDELGSLLLIKRKQGNEPKSKSGGKKRDRSGKEARERASTNSKAAGDPVNPVLAGILYRSSGETTFGSANGTKSTSLQQSQKEIARVAVGKGVRHGFVPHQNKNRINPSASSSQAPGCHQVASTCIAPSPVQASLNALTQNFNQSMHETTDRNLENEGKPAALANCAEENGQLSGPAASHNSSTGRVPYVPGSLRRDDSLVDLAMIPIVGDGTATESHVATSSGFSFVDFPFDANFFSNEDPTV